ncbi:hypothetical protein WP8S18E04_36630 [Aeromonas caviae]|uniref:hypothetical protein n=1 Tax=Aeromonas caviae TaxID=648 RepID=UPI0015DD1614|nr:hypothetical protein [Aeromonas caviae]BBT68279.1 hypothetical protein WP8S18E04_36630 [Aeromonas caviae]
MEVAINDLSFQGQFNNIEDVKKCMLNISKVCEASRKLTGNGIIRRTKTLSSRPLTSEKTIYDFFHGLYLSKNPQDSTLLTTLLTSTIQGPFIKDDEFSESTKQIKSTCGSPVEKSALHSYLSKNNDVIHAVISAIDAPYYTEPVIKIDVAQGVKKTIINFTTDDNCNAYLRLFEANPKHAIKEDRYVNGKLHSKMDISDVDAQKCLDNGFQILGDDCVYCFFNNQWYQFPNHSPGYYHGYPIGKPTNNTAINKIISVFGGPPYESTGYCFCK